MDKTLTHINESGEAHMVNVGDKPITKRRATARAYVLMAPTTLSMIDEGKHKKGDVLSVARIAGIQAAKKCADLIPLCHPLMLNHISVDLYSEADNSRVRIEATCELSGKTGVEMEALCAVSVAALTIYDMCKAVDKNMTISTTQLLEKAVAIPETGKLTASIKILYFASLGERLGLEEECLELKDDSLSVGELKNALSLRGKIWQEQLSSPSLKCALNHKIIDGNPVLKSGDELAFFPPVTGG